MPAGFLDIQIPKKQIDDAMRVMDSRQLKLAVRSAVGKTTREGRVMVRKEVQKTLNVKLSKINEVITNFTKEENGVPVGVIRVKHQGIALPEFKGTRITKNQGVSARPRLDKPQFRLRHAFGATMKSGHKGVFLRERVGRMSFTAEEERAYEAGLLHFRRARRLHLKKQGHDFAPRLPIQEVKAPSVYRVVNVPDVIQRVVANLSGSLLKNFLGQYSRFGLPKPSPN